MVLACPSLPFLWCWSCCFLWSFLLFEIDRVWEKVVSGVPFFSHPVSLMSLLYIPHHNLDDGTGNCRLNHFAVLGVSVLALHEDLFDSCVSFKVYLYTILTMYLFNTFGYSFCVWDGCLSYCGLVSLSVASWIVGLVVVVYITIIVVACIVVVDWIVVACILPVVVKNFLLYPFNGPGGIIAFAQSSS